MQSNTSSAYGCLNGWRDGEKGRLSESTHMYSGIPSKGGGVNKRESKTNCKRAKTSLIGGGVTMISKQ